MLMMGKNLDLWICLCRIIDFFSKTKIYVDRVKRSDFDTVDKDTVLGKLAENKVESYLDWCDFRGKMGKIRPVYNQ